MEFDIKNKIDELNNVRGALVQSVVNKGVDTLQSDATLWQIKDAIDTISNNTSKVSMALVTEYTPAHFVVTSFTCTIESPSDNLPTMYLAAAGEYTVTPETADNPPLQRIYKHNSVGFYIYYVPPNKDVDFWYFGWKISNEISYEIDSNSVVMEEKDLTEFSYLNSPNPDRYPYIVGRMYIKNKQGYQVEESVQAIECVRKDDLHINTSGGRAFAVNKYDYIPEVNAVYLREEDNLIGKPIGHKEGFHLISYIPMHDEDSEEVIVNPTKDTEKFLCVRAEKYPSLEIKGEDKGFFSNKEVEGVRCFGCNHTGYGIGQPPDDDWDWLQRKTIYNANKKLGDIPLETIQKWTVSVGVHMDKRNALQRVFTIYKWTIAEVAVDIDWYNINSIPTIYLNYRSEDNWSPEDIDGLIHENASLSNGWHQVTLTFDSTFLEFVLYIDGVVIGRYIPYSSSIKKGDFDLFYIRCGCNRKYDEMYSQNDKYEYVMGYICELKLYDIPLTADQVASEYNLFRQHLGLDK